MSKNAKHNTIGKGNASRAINGGNDEFFTRPHVALRLTRELDTLIGTPVRVVEPAAGAGAWCASTRAVWPAVPLRAGDLEPQGPRIKREDFLATRMNRSSKGNVVTLGNPPFGFSAALAVKFFNHAARYSDVIAFIVPRTFQKASIHKKLNLSFHLIHEEILSVDDCTFDVDGGSKHVPCVWQVWRRGDTDRIAHTIDVKNNPFVEFTTPDKATHAVRRVGGKAGQVLVGLAHSASTTYFIREKTKGAINTIRRTDYSSTINATAGVRSLSKPELLLPLYKDQPHGE